MSLLLCSYSGPEPWNVSTLYVSLYILHIDRKVVHVRLLRSVQELSLLDRVLLMQMCLNATCMFLLCIRLNPEP